MTYFLSYQPQMCSLSSIPQIEIVGLFFLIKKVIDAYKMSHE